MLKAGFAGDELPSVAFSNYVGTPKHVRLMAGAVEGDHFVGGRADDLRGLLKVRYPMEHGIVNDWADMQRLWSHIYNEELKIHSQEHPVLLTESPLNPRANREEAAELFFETYNVPALFVSMQAVLSLYASGKTTGMVLDCGEGVTTAVPIYEGFAMPHAISRIDLGGRDITRHLVRLLRKAGYAFHTSAEMLAVRSLKEALCKVSYNPKKEESLELDRGHTLQSYTLPDGSVMEIGPERFRAPEVLFNPELIGSEYEGVHEIVVSSITNCDMDLRKTLYSHMVLAGGSTLFRGFGNRLLKEVKELAPKDVKIRIAAPPERAYSAWIGGSILASLATFKKMWISSEEYQEEGKSILHRKCL